MLKKGAVLIPTKIMGEIIGLKVEDDEYWIGVKDNVKFKGFRFKCMLTSDILKKEGFELSIRDGIEIDTEVSDDFFELIQNKKIDGYDVYHFKVPVLGIRRPGE